MPSPAIIYVCERNKLRGTLFWFHIIESVQSHKTQTHTHMRQFADRFGKSRRKIDETAGKM